MYLFIGLTIVLEFKKGCHLYAHFSIELCQVTTGNK